MFPLALFGSIAVALSAIGIYGLLSLSVALQRREIGIRTALGAAPQSISRLIFRDGMRLTSIGIGIVIGLAIALVAARTLETLRDEPRATDPFDRRSYLSHMADPHCSPLSLPCDGVSAAHIEYEQARDQPAMRIRGA